jgi:hypothetical protein
MELFALHQDCLWMGLNGMDCGGDTKTDRVMLVRTFGGEGSRITGIVAPSFVCLSMFFFS